MKLRTRNVLEAVDGCGSNEKNLAALDKKNERKIEIDREKERVLGEREKKIQR